MGQEIIDHIDNLTKKVDCFSACFGFLVTEESETNQEDILSAWKKILRKLLNEIHSLLLTLREETAWSLLYDHKRAFEKIKNTEEAKFNAYKEYEEEEEVRKTISDIVMLLGEGAEGFRKSFIKPGYYQQLYLRLMGKYEVENKEHLETLYQQDCEDLVLEFPDEDQRKQFMVKKCKDELFRTVYGKIYHDKERKIDVTMSHIIDLDEQDDEKILTFFNKMLALKIAKQHSEIKNEPAVKNIVFKENVDVDKVMRKIDDLLKKKVITAQRHWFIVYKVFKEKKWLKKETNRAFIEQMNSLFAPNLRCSSEDFKKIDRYFKDKNYEEWSLEDAQAPSCCERYRDIACLMDQEFTESKYAKPGRMINTKRIVRLD